jgi:HlyD family secretion protein
MAVMQQQAPSKPPTPVSIAAPTARTDKFISVPQMPSWAGRVVYILLGLIAAFAAFALLGKFDMIVKGQGRLAPPNEQINMQVFETSVVKSIDVQIGQRVKKGDRLAILDPTFTSADREDLTNQVAALTAAKERAEAEIRGVPYDPPLPKSHELVQIRIYRDRQAERESRVMSLVKKVTGLQPQLGFAKKNEPYLQEQLELSRQLVKMNQYLVDRGLGYQTKLVEAKTKEVEALSKLIECKRDQVKLTEEITGAESDRDAYLNEWARKLAEDYQKTTGDLDTAEAKLAKAKRRSDLIAMTSPVDGSVLDIPKRNIGSVLREGDTLMTLVPSEATMPVDVAIETKDIAYLRIGQQGRIKFEALPYQEYGSAWGTLTALTADTTKDNPLTEQDSGSAGQQSQGNAQSGKQYYRAHIRIDREEFRNLPDGFELRPGMVASTEIKVGKRTLAAYIFHPLLRPFLESLREPSP